MSSHPKISKENSKSQKPDEELHSVSEEGGRVISDKLAFLEEENKTLRKKISDLEKVEIALRESEETYRVLFDSMSEGITLSELILDDLERPVDYLALYVNPMIEKIIGLPRSMIVGHLISEIFPKMSPPLISFGEMIRTGKPTHFEDYSPTLQKWFEVYAFPLPPGNRFAQIFLDITDRKKAEEALQRSEEKYRNLVERAPDAIIIHLNRKIRYVNPEAMSLLKVSHQEDLIGQDIMSIVPQEYQDQLMFSVDEVREYVGEGISPPIQVPLCCSDGSHVWTEGRITRINFEDKPAFQIFIRDISERKRNEMELKEYTKDLKRSNEDLELFVNIATHDLQEPLRAIVIYSQLLLSKCGEGGTSQIEKYLKIIENAGLQMNTLVNDLREYSRVRTHGKPMEPVDMGTILSNALNNLHIVIRDTGASVTYDELPVVFAEASQMTQVIQNVIDNAIKFRKDGVPPKIHISASLHNDMWQFAIADNGIGIPAEYQNKIFILFERLHGKDAYPGTGLGLALCKQIIERHGGRIWVESEVGNGSTFYFTLQSVKG